MNEDDLVKKSASATAATQEYFKNLGWDEIDCSLAMLKCGLLIVQIGMFRRDSQLPEMLRAIANAIELMDKE